MDRMPDPKKPIIELTPKVQLVAAMVILAASALLGSMVAHTEAPRQTEFRRNFETAPVLVIPAQPVSDRAPAAIELDAEPAPEPAPARVRTGAAI
jgi:hypothetical protein